MINLSRTYNIVGHRDREVLYGASGEQISVAAINFHDSTFDLVEGYQFVQTRPGNCVLNVVSQSGTLTNKQIKDIQRSVSSKFGVGIVCEVKVVSQLELSPCGKYKMILIRNS